MSLLYDKWLKEMTKEDREAYIYKALLDKRRYEDELVRFSINRHNVLKDYLESTQAIRVSDPIPPALQVTLSTPGKDLHKQEVNEIPITNDREGDEAKTGTGKKDGKVRFKSAFKLFKLDHINEVKEKFPEAPFRDRVAVVKKMWKNLSSNEKYLYVKRSRLDKKRFASLSCLLSHLEFGSN
jgi:hypothetical protein